MNYLVIHSQKGIRIVCYFFRFAEFCMLILVFYFYERPIRLKRRDRRPARLASLHVNMCVPRKPRGACPGLADDVDFTEKS